MMVVWRENPKARIEERDGVWWHEDPCDDQWVRLGFAPTPTTRWRTLLRHIHHGRLMRYPWRAVLPFSISAAVAGPFDSSYPRVAPAGDDR
jgi:hypothetical protein